MQYAGASIVPTKWIVEKNCAVSVMHRFFLSSAMVGHLAIGAVSLSDPHGWSPIFRFQFVPGHKQRCQTLNKKECRRNEA